MKASTIAAVVLAGAACLATTSANAHWVRADWERIYAPPYPYTEGWYLYERSGLVRRVYLPAYEKYSPSLNYAWYSRSVTTGYFPAVTARYGRPYWW